MVQQSGTYAISPHLPTRQLTTSSFSYVRSATSSRPSAGSSFHERVSSLPIGFKPLKLTLGLLCMGVELPLMIVFHPAGEQAIVMIIIQSSSISLRWQ